MTLKTSLLITGDTAGAQKAVDDLARKNEALGTSGRAAAGGLEVQDRAQATAATSAKALAVAEGEAAGGLRELAAAAGATGGAVGGVANEITRTNTAVTSGTAALKGSTAAVNDNDQAMRRHQQGVRSAGQQVGDFFVTTQGGLPVMTAFTQQFPQLAYAMSDMQGRAGKLGTFLVGPWGIALTVGTALLGPFVAELFNAGEAAERAELAASGLSQAQGLMAEIFGKTSSKIAEQNDLLRINARLMAINLRAEAATQRASSEAAFNAAGSVSIVDRLKGAITGEGDGAFSDLFGGSVGTSLGRRNAANLSNLVQNVRAGRLSEERALQLSETQDFTGTKVSQVEFQKAIRDAVASRLNERLADLVDQSLDAGSIAAGLQKPSTQKKPPKPKSTEARDEFGRDAADRIAQLTAQFDSTPPLVRQVEQAGRQLADIIDDLQRRKPPGFEQLIADAREAGGVIRAGINRPLDDFLEAQQQQLDQGTLILQGRVAEAEAARAIAQIERQRGPLTAEQRQEVLATVVALQAQERQLEKIRAVQEINLGALEDMRAIVRETIYEGPESIAKLPGRVLESFKRYSADKLAEELFGDLFRDIGDEITGQGKIDAAATEVAGTFQRTASAATSLASSLENAAARASRVPASGSVADVVGSDEIVVNGRRAPPESEYANVYARSIAGIVEKIGGKAGGLFGLDTKSSDGQQRLKDLGKDIGNTAGKALGGAFEGQAASGFASLLGIKQSSTGSAIGGAIGSFLPIPGGSIIGGLLGGTLGGLLGKTKTGSATIGNVDGQTAITGSGGNNAELRKAASGLAGSVNSALDTIVETLGGTLGNYAVSIGQRGDRFVVDQSGRGSTKYGKANDGITAYDTAEEAQAAALADAIRDGAVAGLSAAMQRAFQSTTDVDRALKEALKVQDLELLLGGSMAEIQKAYRDFDRQAAERVRIARAYGFDVLEIERRNAADRLKLTEQLVDAQVGSLKALVEEITAGSLFEGSALDRIDALNAAIATAKADLDKGVDGAADTLAQLYQQRLAATKDAYGTTGGYADARNATLDEARAAIAAANARITAAQAPTSDPALKATNEALDENNDQNAEILGELRALNAAVAAGAGGSGGSRSFDLAKLAFA